MRTLYALVVATIFLSPIGALAADFSSRNVTVRAPTPELAKEIALRAEQYIGDLTAEWFPSQSAGRAEPISIEVAPGLRNRSGRGRNGEARVELNASHPFLMDGVLPHELMHVLTHEHIGAGVPFWLREGIACAVEESSARRARANRGRWWSQHRLGEPFSLKALFHLSRRPEDARVLYMHGSQVTDYLLDVHGREALLTFVRDALRGDEWERSSQRNLGGSLLHVEQQFLRWRSGRSEPDTMPGLVLASSRPPA